LSILDIFRYPDLFLPPLLAGVALAAACSVMSVLVVLKRLAFIGQGISHAGFGGVGLAAFLGFTVSGSAASYSAAEGFGFSHVAHDLIVFLFCVGTGIAIGVLSRRRDIKIDTAIGILLVAAMALGVLLEQGRRQLVGRAWYDWLRGGRALTTTNWHAVLFGSMENLTTRDMWLAIAVSIIVLAMLALLFKEIIFYSFDERVSQVFGVPSGFVHYLMLVMMAVLIVFTMKLTGLILVNAFLVIPGATATLLSRRLRTVLVLAVAVGETGLIVGYLLTFALGGDLPTGPMIVLTLATIFALAWMSRRRLGPA